MIHWRMGYDLQWYPEITDRAQKSEKKIEPGKEGMSVGISAWCDWNRRGEKSVMIGHPLGRGSLGTRPLLQLHWNCIVTYSGTCLSRAKIHLCDNECAHFELNEFLEWGTTYYQLLLSFIMLSISNHQSKLEERWRPTSMSVRICISIVDGHSDYWRGLNGFRSCEMNVHATAELPAYGHIAHASKIR